MMEDMRKQFLDLLSEIGFVDKSHNADVSHLLWEFSIFYLPGYMIMDIYEYASKFQQKKKKFKCV